MRRVAIRLLGTPVERRRAKPRKTSTKWLTKGRQDSIFNNMVELHEAQLSAVFHALGDITRRRMLRLLADGEHTVGQLAEPFHMSLAAASKHIKALESAGLIRREVRGRIHLCQLNAGPLAAADEWLAYYERFWHERLDRLEELLRSDSARDAAARAATATLSGSGAKRPKSATSKKRSKR
jgi:DNA-binding transcriptional ArsR family regulator